MMGAGAGKGDHVEQNRPALDYREKKPFKHRDLERVKQLVGEVSCAFAVE